MLRVSGGVAKGRNLIVPKVPGIRITQEIAREALFSIISDHIKDAVCLDLYAGSGSVGIEALSRGASWCDFVDINDESQKAVVISLKYCGFELSSHFYKDDATKFATSCTKRYNYIFMDPYYDQAVHKHIFKLLPNLLEKDGTVVFFHGKELITRGLVENSRFEVTDERAYGATILSFLTLKQGLI